MGANQGTIKGHNVKNYYIGKGVVSIKLPGDEDYVDYGNCSSVTLLPKPTVLDHYSSRTGTKTKDFTAITQKDVTLSMAFDEMSARGFALALMGNIIDSGSPGGNVTIDIFSESIINGAFKFVGDNDTGPQWTIELPSVNFSPSKAIDLISDAWGGFEIQGDVLADDSGSFGTATATLNDQPVA